MQCEVLMEGRQKYSHDPMGLIAAGHVIAVEFATISAANNYWRN
jgi:Hexameric tyrosine-coordinated heme protein (HTHP)